MAYLTEKQLILTLTDTATDDFDPETGITQKLQKMDSISAGRVVKRE
jgi:hypothetical protein